MREFFERVYAPAKLRGKSDKTVYQYQIQIGRFGTFLNHEPTLADLVDDTVTQFLAWIVAQGRTPATANKARNHLLALWRFAARKNLVREFPDVMPHREPRRVPKAWTQADLTKLFGTCDCVAGGWNGILAADWWIALHAVMWDSAERVGAVMQIEWCWIDLETGWLIVPAEARKFQREDKAFLLHPQTVGYLEKIRHSGSKFVFVWPWTRQTLWIRYAKILADAGLPTDRKSKFHRMRKSAASWFEAAGGNATDLLGHTARRTTEAYLDPRIVPKPQASNLLFRPDLGATG